MKPLMHPSIGSLAWTAGLVGLVAAMTSFAGEPPATLARDAFALAGDAAKAWAADATLIYLENDEDVDASGASRRWGYLFYSPELGDARAYSVSGGKIAATLDPTFRFDAPPLPEAWLDSDGALRLALEQVRDHGFDVPASMVLLRGAFDEKQPDRTCWLVCFRREGEPATFVVVDSAEARVVRTWRG
jgi:hypothetical protein